MSNNIKKIQALELLRLHYGFSSFRPGQEKAIDSALAGKDSLVIMPTGGGKSLCYQLPALVLDGVTLVISPLIALMKDQVDGLEKVGVPAAFINSSIAPDESKRRMEKAQFGDIKLLYIAPERFYNQEFTHSLTGLKVSLLAVDEAHCISEWGHDFRPSYLKLREAVLKINRPPIMALTATATPEVRADIVKQLGLDGREEIITGFSRPNLQFGVIRAKESEKLGYLLKSVETMPDGSGIIYTGTRSKADEITDYLLSKNISAVVYHAGMQPDDRKWVQDSFMRDKVKIIVATNAFGLGIDKKDIRFVIHYDMPGTLEAYYQEAGRAGRDGKPSFCLLFYNHRDRYLREFFIKGDNPAPETILDLYEHLLSYEAERILVTYGELKSALSLDAPDMAVGTSLKILESAGLVGRTREKSGQGYLKFTAAMEKIEASITGRSKVSGEILKNLSAKFTDSLYKGFEFNSVELASAIGAKREALMRLVNKLNSDGLAVYRPPFKGTEIMILKRIPANAVELDRWSLKKKLEKAYQKLDLMEEYVFHNFCRQAFILDYFGERGADNCAKCDNCLNDFKKAATGREFAGGRKRTLKRRPDYRVDTRHSAMSGLATKLTQLATYDLYNQGMGIEEIARERNLTAGTVIGHLCYLMENGKDIDIGKFITRDKINKILKAQKKAGKGKLKPIMEELDDGEITYDEIKLVLAASGKSG